MTIGPARAVPNNVLIEWGSPTVIQKPWEAGKGFDAVTKIPDQTFWVMDKKHPENAGDEAIVMLYMARQIVAHGGRFCATQARSRNSGNSKKWTQYQNPETGVEKTCFWLCEPGFTGEGCKEGTITQSTQCNYTQLSTEFIGETVTYNETGGYDKASVEDNLRQNNNQAFFRFGEGKVKDGNEQDVVLTTKSFLENGHGIVASPAKVSAHRGMWHNTDYSDEGSGGKSDSNITVTANTANYKTKTLCMPGFDGPGCTSTLCRVCDDVLTKYSEKTGACTDCIENHVHDANGTCVPCPDGAVAVAETDTCLKCKKTEYVRDGKCVMRSTISKTAMYNCYPNQDATDFSMCVRNTCEGDVTVKCITDNRQLGTKKCVSGKWAECVANQS